MLGDNIKKHRKEKNISQEELAEKIGVSRQSISFWENGKANPSLDTISKLASILGTSVGELLGSENTDENKNDDDTQATTEKNNNAKKLSKKFWLVLLLVIAFVGLIVGGWHLLFNKDFADNPTKIETASKSVVKINCYNSRGDLSATGSGFAMFEDGVIITNYHVIEKEAFSVELILDDNSKHKVNTVVAIDKENDIAILKSEKNLGLSLLEKGDTKKLKKGEKVVAIGSPLGLINTVSTGVFSGFAQNEVLQFTASISNGSSGGALFDNEGKVLGITFASFKEGQNLNLAIPIEKVVDLWNENKNNQLSLKDVTKPEKSILKVHMIFLDADMDDYSCEYYLAALKSYDENNSFTMDRLVGYGMQTFVVNQETWETGTWVEEIENWCLDTAREVGDSAIIENAYGKTLCYISQKENIE